MSEIAVMGDRDSIYGFAALGMSVYPTEDGEDSQQACGWRIRDYLYNRTACGDDTRRNRKIQICRDSCHNTYSWNQREYRSGYGRCE